MSINYTNDKFQSVKALIIEDDISTRNTLKIILESNGISCDAASIGSEGLEIAKIYDYDIIILDLMLPDLDGYEILLRLRSAKVSTPVLILSGLSSKESKVKSFGAGADDYLTKPFDKDEIVARIWAIIRRSKGLSESKVKIGKMTINLDSKTVDYNNNKLNLTKSEYSILHLLSLRKNSIITKEMALNHLYGRNSKDEPGIKIIDVFVCNLRRKLRKISNGKTYIKTLWGRGYTLKYEEE